MAKIHNRPDWEDRARPYREFRHNLGYGAVIDIDQLEARFHPDGSRTFVAAIELTTPDSIDPLSDNGYVLYPHSYCQKALDRYSPETNQGKLLLQAASGVGVPVFIVVFERPVRNFYVYNLSTERGWWKLSIEEYTGWIKSDCRFFPTPPSIALPEAQPKPQPSLL